MRAQRVPPMGGGAGVFFLAFLVLRAVPMLADSTLAKAGPVIQVQSVEPAGRNDSYNATSVVGRKDGGGGGGGGGGSSGETSWSYGWGWGWGTEGGGGGGGGGGGSGGGGGGGGGCGGWTRTERHRSGVGAVRARSARRHRPSYSSNLYHVGEYARCTAPGRCRGMQLLCPMHCEGPCFYDCDANCKAHCRF